MTGSRWKKPRDNTNMREIRGGPAGGGYSTVQDMVKFHMALRSYKLLNQEVHGTGHDRQGGRPRREPIWLRIWRQYFRRKTYRGS